MRGAGHRAGRVVLPPAKLVPQSAVVFDEKLALRAKLRILAEKYIASGADFEVNISHPCRNGRPAHFALATK